MSIKIFDIITAIEQLAPKSFQEAYDNSGLIIGDDQKKCNGVLICLDITESVLKEAVEKKCNLIITHHPFIFSAIKKINFKTQQDLIIQEAIKKDISLYAIHTNLDNVIDGVNRKIADILSIKKLHILKPKENLLKKLSFYAPIEKAPLIRQKIFEAGAGEIGNYSECSFNSEGIGSFKANANTKPFVGNKNQLHFEKESKIEMVFYSHLQNKIINTLLKNHPYEEVAFDIVNINNTSNKVGNGIIGELQSPMETTSFLKHICKEMSLKILKHTQINKPTVYKVALCGGAGSFLIEDAINKEADIFITADLKYHDYFKAENKIILVDIGHYESEVHTIDLIYQYLINNFTKFARLFKTSVNTNPVNYLIK